MSSGPYTLRGRLLSTLRVTYLHVCTGFYHHADRLWLVDTPKHLTALFTAPKIALTQLNEISVILGGMSWQRLPQTTSNDVA